MYYLGVDLGGTNIAIGLVDENLKIVLKDKIPTGASRPTGEIMDDMAALCKSIVERAGITFDDIEYVGIAAPGSIDPKNGIVRYSNNIELSNYPMVQELKNRIPVKKVLLENDANAAALAEAKVGAGKGCDHLIMITLGTGVGGGIVIDGKLYSGFNYTGAELGHTVIEVGGRPCTCGRRHPAPHNSVCMGCHPSNRLCCGRSHPSTDDMVQYRSVHLHKEDIRYRSLLHPPSSTRCFESCRQSLQSVPLLWRHASNP